MVHCKLPSWRAPVLILACLPLGVEAQCNVIMTTTFTVGPTMVVNKQLSAPALCVSTGMNAQTCYPGPVAMTLTVLTAAANVTATVSPYCNWDCNCGTGAPPHVITDGSDGLPVELMEFSVSQDDAVPLADTTPAKP